MIRLNHDEILWSPYSPRMTKGNEIILGKRMNVANNPKIKESDRPAIQINNYLDTLNEPVLASN